MEKVLVLNSDYTPINITTVYRGFNLVTKGKAEILKYKGNSAIMGDTNKARKPTNNGNKRHNFSKSNADN